MNTRLQVEHPVTELITGIDLVEQMIRVAAGEKLKIAQKDVKLDGWAIESRLYAEDPYRNFLPSIGRLTRYAPPPQGRQDNGVTVRNDTGVYEGGEISMFYDPMIAKLCTHAPDRKQAIAAMAEALDEFEVEGIGHNLPFLSAVMQHSRFQKGRLTTGFIAEEWPDGFAGVKLSKKTCEALASIAASCNFVYQQRATRISGVVEHHRRVISKDWMVTLDGHEFPLAIERDGETLRVTHVGAKPVIVDLGGWRPGTSLIRARIGRSAFTVKIERKAQGFRVRYRGADFRVFCRTPREAELARLMLEKQAADTSKMLLCPMPGLVVTIAVKEGDEIQEGQPLVTVEAMKMENILRAERKTKVTKINAKAGDSLAVDDVIMEFE
jgi:propionyl-CoA carboxylase alpha chain